MTIRKMLLTSIFILAGNLFADQPKTLHLAISDLTAQGVKESEAAVISEQLGAELMKSPRIKLLERNQVQEILKEQGFQQSGCVNDACAVEVGQMLGVENIMVGTVGLAGSYTLLSVRVIDVATGTIVANVSTKTKGGIDKMLELGVEEAASKLNAALFPETGNKS